MNKFRQAVDTELCNVRITSEILENLETEKHMKKKLSFATVMVCALVLVAVTATAFTVSEIIRQKMEPVAEMQLTPAWDKWDLQVKTELIDRMREWGLAMDEEKLAAVKDNNQNEAVREQAADEIIFSAFTAEELAVIQADHPDVEQQEEYPIPSDYTIFRVLWLKESPESDESEIRAAYDEWEAELIAKVNEQYTPVIYTSCEEDVRAMFDLNMSEVLSMSKSERNAAKIDVAQVEGFPLWQVTMTVQGKDLRAGTKQTLSAGSVLSPEGYDVSTDTYTCITLFEETENGLARVPDARSAAEYEYTKLTESLAWPGSEDDVHGYYHRFLTASAAEKAAFTADYRPTVEAWYAAHPEFFAKLEKAYDEGTKLDTLYMVTRHTYGMPDDSAKTEDDIRVLAADTYAKVCGNALPEELLGEKFEMYLWYDVTDVANPVWKVTVTAGADNNPTGYMNYETRHMVFAPDGTLLRDGGELHWIAGIETPAADPISASLTDSDGIEF